MASLTKEIALSTSGEDAWAMLRDVGAADKAFAGVLTASRLDGDVRTVTFAGGMVVRERIVHIDDAARRTAYGVIEGRFSWHHASMQILAQPDGTSRFVWIADFLPEETAPLVKSLMSQGAEAFKKAVEARP